MISRVFDDSDSDNERPLVIVKNVSVTRQSVEDACSIEDVSDDDVDEKEEETPARMDNLTVADGANNTSESQSLQSPTETPKVNEDVKNAQSAADDSVGKDNSEEYRIKGRLCLETSEEDSDEDIEKCSSKDNVLTRRKLNAGKGNILLYNMFGRSFRIPNLFRKQ